MTFPDLSRYDVLGVDTETTGLTWNDRPVGLSIAARDGMKRYLRWGHEGGNNCTREEFHRWADEQLRGKLLVMHNAAFDLRMLAYEGLPHIAERNRVEDTGFIAALLNENAEDLSLEGLGQAWLGEGKKGEALDQWCAEHFGGRATRSAQGKNYWRAPGSVVEEYAEEDAALTLRLYDRTRPLLAAEDLESIYDLETSLIPLLLRMHLVGVRADERRAIEIKQRLGEELARARAEFKRLCGDVNINSTKQVADLFRRLGLPVWKTPVVEKDDGTTTGGNDSVPKDLRDHIDHPVAKLISKIKRLEKFQGTFIDSYVLDVLREDGCIHGEFHPLRNSRYGTVSGRFSSGGDLNLQNIPARDEEFAPLLRGMFVPYFEDQVWLKADYSQIEYRYLAHYAGGQLRAAYLNDPMVDFHEMCARLTGLDRGPAKSINFGFVYGMGEALLATKLGKPLEEAREIFEQYHSRLPEVRQLYNKASRLAERRGWIRTWGGRLRRFEPNKYYGQERVSKRGKKYIDRNRHAATHKALNALLQGSAADLMKMAMRRVADLVDWENVHLHLTVHDELDFSVPRGEIGQRFAADLKEAMEDFQLTVPVRAELESGPDWGHVGPLDLAP